MRLHLLLSFPCFIIFLEIFVSHEAENQLVCVHTHLCVFVCVFCFYLCVCVYGFGGMNPNEIFYGPVDLLIVPQVLSLLAPHLFETTYWAWFFSPFHLLIVLFFNLSSSSSPLKLTPSLFNAASSNLKLHTTFITYCNQRMVVV